MLKCINISKSFGPTKALSEVNLEVKRGEIHGLIGENGSGKSTCVNLISGVYSIDEGSVYFQGQLINNLSVPARAKLGIARTFQTPKPFTGTTVYDSIYTAAMQTRTLKEARDKTEEVLGLTELSSLAYMKSEKLPIEKRKWLDLARILAIDAKLIMLDEVMAGLNPSEMDSSIELVKKVNKMGITIIFIEHVMKAVNNLCNRVIVFDDGHFLCEGETREVLNNPLVIKAYLGEDYYVEG